MKREEAIARLKELRDCSLHYESYKVREDDTEALECAIKELAAPEVPVQEQLIDVNRK